MKIENGLELSKKQLAHDRDGWRKDIFGDVPERACAVNMDCKREVSIL